MPCYFRHLRRIFRRTGVAPTEENRMKIDGAIRDILGVKHMNCPATWRKVKKRIAEDEEGFASELKEALTRRRKG